MMNLNDKHPDALAEFKSGTFVVHQTSNRFSAMSIDQCHEQNNAVVKGSGGAVGLTGNPEALQTLDGGRARNSQDHYRV